MRHVMAVLLLSAPLAAPMVHAADDPDESFFKNAAEAGIAEVSAGQQAVQKATNQKVKDFGQEMVTDHTKANDELKQLAATKNVKLPTTPSVGEMAEKTKLDVLTGNAYDKSYINGQIKDHEEVISMFRKEANSGQDAEAKAWARQKLPVLEKHLRMARKVAAENGYSDASTSSGR
jgi:putative membrane protein